MKTYKHNFLLLLFVLFGANAFAQSKIMEKTYKVNPNAVVEINARHTNIQVDYWDKNEVQVTALVNTQDLEKEARKQVEEKWKPKVEASSNRIKISSDAVVVLHNMDMAAIEAPLAQLPEMLAPLMENLGPMLENITRNPLPPEFHQSMSGIKFDYEAFQKDGDKYIEKFEKEMEGRFGKDFEKSMEAWAKNFEKDSEKMKDFEMKMEAWGESFGKDMEAWGESFGKSMEAWASNFEKQMENGNFEDRKVKALKNRDGAAMKSLKLMVPKQAKLQLNVRHGDVKLSGTTQNLNADFSHSKFSANRIAGKDTRVNVAYSPVNIKDWDYGVLNASYVKNFNIDKARSIKLSCKSSDVTIKEIGETGILAGSFGELNILKLNPDFKTLEISLENSDLKLKLPGSAYDFVYRGSQSKVKVPSGLSLKTTKSYDKEILNGYHKAQGQERSININANFSEVVLD